MNASSTIFVLQRRTYNRREEWMVQHEAWFQRLRRINLTAVVVTMISGPVALAQPTTTRDIRAWVDDYYAEYSAMSAAPTGPAMDKWLARYAPFTFFEDPTLGAGVVGRDTIRK